MAPQHDDSVDRQPDLPGGGPRPAGPLAAGPAGAAVLRQVDRASIVQTENIFLNNNIFLLSPPATNILLSTTLLVRFYLNETSLKDDIIFSRAYLEREELILLFLDLKTSPLFITFFPDVAKFLVLFICYSKDYLLSSYSGTRLLTRLVTCYKDDYFLPDGLLVIRLITCYHTDYLLSY